MYINFYVRRQAKLVSWFVDVIQLKPLCFLLTIINTGSWWMLNGAFSWMNVSANSNTTSTTNTISQSQCEHNIKYALWQRQRTSAIALRKWVRCVNLFCSSISEFEIDYFYKCILRRLLHHTVMLLHEVCGLVPLPQALPPSQVFCGFSGKNTASQLLSDLVGGSFHHRERTKVIFWFA